MRNQDALLLTCMNHPNNIFSDQELQLLADFDSAIVLDAIQRLIEETAAASAQ